tara:strand:+ start:1919 stop:2644 length:726 start_codon:yes stop_codon:yes gene_type:complete
MKTIYNKISNIINSMLEKVGYFFVGYKVDIEQNIFDIKAIRKYKVGLHEFKNSIKALRDTQSHIIDDIKAIQLTIKPKRVNLNDLKDELTKPCKNNIDDNILMLENIINTITEAKINNACQVVSYGKDIVQDKVPYLSKYSMKEILEHYIKIDDNDDKIAQLKIKVESLERVNTIYERLLTSDNNYILEEIAKLLVRYEKEDNLQFYKINDIVDDINDRFNEFNNIYNDACDDDNNINLTK